MILVAHPKKKHLTKKMLLTKSTMAIIWKNLVKAT